MLVAIAGGALQGLEITYLAKKAGFDTLLLDKNRDAPATRISDSFVTIDFTDSEALTGALESVDLVIPATENLAALESLTQWCNGNRKPLAFDAEAYAISSSKTKSNTLFRKLGIPTPAPWPDCTFPVVAKPDSESGSKGVQVFRDLPALEARFETIPPSDRILQEYLFGPSYSIEVIGRPGEYSPMQITDLEMDRDYDCKRVLAPTSLPPNLTDRLEGLAVTLAEAVRLSGIMDVEVILHEGQLRVLEIDARFPSQTPITVYHSTGFNMVERLVEMFFSQNNDQVDVTPDRPIRGTILEHIRVCDGHLTVCGEHIMVEDGPLHLEPSFFGANAALTSYGTGKEEWVATLIVEGTNLKDARERRDQVIKNIRSRFGLSGYSDDYPEEPLGHTQ